jgi:hypothetical protein
MDYFGVPFSARNFNSSVSRLFFATSFYNKLQLLLESERPISGVVCAATYSVVVLESVADLKPVKFCFLLLTCVYLKSEGRASPELSVWAISFFDNDV